jgi:hypothetical protein
MNEQPKVRAWVFSSYAALLAVGASGAVSGVSCTARDDTSDVAVRRAALETDGGVPAINHEYAVLLPMNPGQTPVPSARKQPAMAFDAKDGVAVLFGGYALNVGPLADTWSYDGAWLPRCGPTSCPTHPSARSAMALAYVPGRQVVVLHGGATALGEPLCDTWEWTSGGGWVSVSSPTCGTDVLGRAGLAMAGSGQIAAAFGGVTDGNALSGDLVAWNGQSWSTLCDAACVTRSDGKVPAPRAFASMVHAAVNARDVFLVFGGSVANGTSSGSHLASDLWEFDIATSKWTERCTSAACLTRAPGVRTEHAAAFDTARHQMVVHGGCKDTACASDHAEYDEYDPATDSWAVVPLATLPASSTPQPRHDAAMTFDATRRHVVEFGGFSGGAFLGAPVDYYTRGNACGGDGDCDSGDCVKVLTADNLGVCAEHCTATGPSGSCVTAFACDTACNAPCQSCSRIPGVCTPVTSGPDAEPGTPLQSQCTDGHTCTVAPGNTAGACLLDKGQACNVGTQCASGYCSSQAPQICVDRVCNLPCQMPQAGLCVSRGRGAEPSGVGCDGFRCGDDGACLATCTSSSDCVPNTFCDAGSHRCLATQELGHGCQTATECKLGNCVDGVCCNSACDGACDECGADGKCKPRPASSAPADGHAPCLGTGTCGGYCGGGSDCVQPNASTSCDPSPTCVERDYLLGSGACNGNGACVAPKGPVSCGAFSCDAARGDCYRECDQDSQCRRGAVCQIAADGHGVCNDEGVVCADDYELRTPKGIVDCLGYPCNGVACAFKPCSATAPADCAEGYTCTEDHRCVPGSTPADAAPAAPKGQAGKAPAADGGIDAGTGSPDLQSSDSSCNVGRTRGRRSAEPLALSAALAFLVLQRGRRTTRSRRRDNVR